MDWDAHRRRIKRLEEMRRSITTAWQQMLKEEDNTGGYYHQHPFLGPMHYIVQHTWDELRQMELTLKKVRDDHFNHEHEKRVRAKSERLQNLFNDGKITESEYYDLLFGEEDAGLGGGIE